MFNELAEHKQNDDSRFFVLCTTIKIQKQEL